MVLKNSYRIALLAACGLALLVVSGCSAKRAFVAGEEFALKKQYDEAVASFQTALVKDPENNEYRRKLLETRSQAAMSHLTTGRELFSAGRRGDALLEFRKATTFDPSLEVAAQEAKKVENLLLAEQLVAEGEGFFRNRRFPQARASVDQALNLDPENAQAKALRENIRQGNKTVMDGVELEVSSDQPINLKFKQTGIKDAFNILSKLSGINFILDDEIKAQANVNLLLENATFPQALELILQLNKLGKKVLNSKTIIIYPRTKDKDKQFDDYVVQTFFLSNIDAKKAVNLLRTMLQLRKIYVHEELNALVIRDTPEVLKLCAQILESADRADAEVVFDLELYSVNATEELDYGAKLAAYQSTFGLVDGPLSTTNLITNGVSVIGSKGLDSLKFAYTIPYGTLKLSDVLSNAEILANPKIRVKNNEKANVLVGTKEPIVTVTNSGGTGGTYQDNITYVDVGVKVDVEANVLLDDRVEVKLKLEVSSAERLEATKSGTTPVRISTTNATTVLTLRDGEQTIIGGLVSSEDTKTRSGFPVMSKIPLLGALFSSTGNKESKREIVLSITPRIVKKIDMPLPSAATIWSGGEEDLKAGPAFGTFAGSFEPQTDKMPAAAAPALGSAAPKSAPAPIASVAPAKNIAPSASASEVATPGATPAEFAEPAVVETPVEPSEEPVAAVIPEEAVVPLSEPSAEALTTPTPEVSASSAVAEPPVSSERVVLPPFAVPPAGDGTLTFALPGAVKVGDEVVVEVGVSGANTLFSAPLFVDYDAALLKFVRGEEGEFLKRGGVATVFAISPMPGQGQLIIGYKQGVGGSGASGDGSLFRLHFSALAPGSASLKLERINFRNPSGARLKVDPAAASVEIR